MTINNDRTYPYTPSSSTTTTTTQAYGEAWYWDKRYEATEASFGSGSGAGAFDWYQKYTSLSTLVHLYIPRNRRVLVVGCGNSAFSEGMDDDGYEDVVSIDISSVVIQAMQNKYSNRSHLKYMTMDVTNMSSFEAGHFDAVVDKGTLDSIMCGTNSRKNAAKMLEEVCRVLKDKGGVYILITYGAPIFRLQLLRDCCSWVIKLHAIEKVHPEERLKRQTWELTSPIPLLGDDASSMEAVLGKNPDVHYIYVCIKQGQMIRAEEEGMMQANRMGIVLDFVEKLVEMNLRDSIQP